MKRILIIFILLIGCGGGGGSGSPAPPSNDQPVIVNPDAPPFVWGESKWGEGRWE